MALIKFLSDDSIRDAGIRMEGHRIVLTFQEPITTITSLISVGFQTLNEYNQTVMSDFSGHKYLYHEDVDNFVFTITNEADDVWHEQPPVPPAPEPPAPHVPTLDEVKAQKVAEINRLMEEAIANGTDVTLSDGTVEHFTCTDRDQISLASLRSLAEAGVAQIPWHTSDHSEFCKFYSAEDIILITNAALEYVTYMVTLFRDERIWIESMRAKKTVEAVTFPQIPPEEYQSEVLKDILSKISS